MALSDDMGNKVLVACAVAAVLLLAAVIAMPTIVRLLPKDAEPSAEAPANRETPVATSDEVETLEGFDSDRISSYRVKEDAETGSREAFDFKSARLIREFSGEGDMVTPTFKVSSPNWAFVHITRPGPYGTGAFVAVLVPHGASPEDGGIEVAAVEGRNVSYSIQSTGPDDFYFVVGATQPWNIGVFDMSSGEQNARGEHFINAMEDAHSAFEEQRAAVKSLYEGMTLDEVAAALGGNGKKSRGGRVGGKEVSTYVWYLSDGPLLATFEDNELISWER